MAGLFVASSAIQAVYIGTVESHGSCRKIEREFLLPASGFLSWHGRDRPGMLSLPHTGVAELLMEMADPAFAFYRRDWDFLAPTGLTG